MEIGATGVVLNAAKFAKNLTQGNVCKALVYFVAAVFSLFGVITTLIGEAVAATVFAGLGLGPSDATDFLC